jgi:hypothetical protein
MSLEFVTKQAYITQKLNDVNDTVAGNQLAGGTASFTSAAAVPLYALIGVRILLDNVAALALSDTVVGTLYAGIYQYVNLLSGGTNAGVRGQMAFWGTTQTAANIFAADGITPYSVHADGSATLGDGLWLGPFINALTKGNFGWIQIAGIASVLFQATPTSNLVGAAVVVNTAGVTVDSRADATAVTYGAANGMKNFLGVALELPGASGAAAIKRILLRPNSFNF